jgi:hypothetical protein
VLLNVRPGITDFTSIIFSDEGDILAGIDDPDLRYNQLILPWKSGLGLLYVKRGGSALLDLRLILLTLMGSLDRAKALAAVSAMVRDLGGGAELAAVATRAAPLGAVAPRRMTDIVRSREIPVVPR